MSSSSSRHDPIDRRPFGRHADLVSIIGLGGYHLGKAKTVAEAVRIVHEAIDAGVNFLDNAWEYHDGESERRMGRAIEDRRDSVFLMTKVCTHGRDAKVAMRQLDESLRRLRTDYLDLWQIHECVYYNDPERHFARGGVVEALERAKAQGKVRYVGFTGHKDPEIHLRMLSFDFPFDACQLPLNGFDANFRSFQTRVLPELARQKIAAIGMKSLGGDGRVVKKKAARVDDALRYAMSLPVCTTVSGIDSLKVLRQNLRIARGFSPMTARGAAGVRAEPRRRTRWTGASSSTRRAPSTRARSAASSTASRRRKRSRCDGPTGTGATYQSVSPARPDCQTPASVLSLWRGGRPLRFVGSEQAIHPGEGQRRRADDERRLQLSATGHRCRRTARWRESTPPPRPGDTPRWSRTKTTRSPLDREILVSSSATL